MRYRLLDKTALVTGGASGIGKAICVQLVSEGAFVVVLDKQLVPCEGGDNVLQLMEQARKSANLSNDSHKPTYEFVEGDVLNVSDITKALKCVQSFTGRVDILVNNAAKVSGGQGLLDTTPEGWDNFMSVNVKGAFLTTQAAVKVFLEQEPVGSDRIRGKIVNITSQHGVVAAPNNIAYGCSKAALNYMTKQVAIDFIKYGIVVNAVAPGRILTGREGSRSEEDARNAGVELSPREVQGLLASKTRTPHSEYGRLGSPSDVAKAVAFLASEYSSYTVGETLVVDGGYLAS